MATQLTIPPIVSQEAAELRQREQAQAQQNLMNFAQMRMNAERNREAQADRDMNAWLTIMRDPDAPDQFKLVAGQNLWKALGMTGTPELDAIRPLGSVVTKMVEAQRKDPNADLTMFAPYVDLIQKDPRLIRQAQLPAFTGLAESMRGQQAEQAVRLIDPDIQGAIDRTKGRQTELSSLQQQADQFKSAVDAPDRLPSDRRLALGQLQRLGVLQEEENRDQAVIQANTYRVQRNEQIKAVIKRNPKLLEDVTKVGLQEAGFYPLDEGFLKLRLQHYQSQPREQLTADELRKMDSLSRLLPPYKSVLSDASSASLALLDARMRHATAEEKHLDTTLQMDAQGVDQVNQLRPHFDALMQRAQVSTMKDEDWKALESDSQQVASAISGAKLASIQANSKQVNAWIDDRADLERRNQDLLRQVGTTPSADRGKLLEQRTVLDGLIAARDAQMDLVTKYHPLEGLEHETTLELQQAEVGRLQQALKGTVSETDREKFGAELDRASAIVSSEEKFMKDWRKGRGDALRSVEQARRQQQAQAASFKQKMIYGQHTLEKDEATNLLARTILTDVSARDPKERKTMSQSVAENQKHELFRNADVKAALGIVKTAMEGDEHSALNQAQDYYNAFLAAEPNLTPQRLAKHAREAVAQTEKETGIKVSVDDVQKVGPAPKTVGEGLEPTKLQSMWKSVVTTAAQLSGNSGIQVSTGETGLPEITIGTVKDPVKLAEMIQTLTTNQGFLPESVRTSLIATATALKQSRVPTGALLVVPATPAPPVAPGLAPAADVEQRLKEKYLQP